VVSSSSLPSATVSSEPKAAASGVSDTRRWGANGLTAWRDNVMEKRAHKWNIRRGSDLLLEPAGSN